VIGLFVGYAAAIATVFIRNPGFLFQDAHIYWRATEAWVNGGDPWAASYNGILFAAPPPALLLNLPLQPFGESLSSILWPTLDVVGMVFLVRHLRLAWWWLLFPPFVEGVLNGSADPALAAGLYLGLGWLSIAVKPYSLPLALGAGRWRSVAAAAVLVAVTAGILPWRQFLEASATFSTALAGQTLGLSAWGQPVLLMLCLVVLLTLERGMAGGLATPTLWPYTQLHYASFSVWAASRSPIVAVGLALPLPFAPVAGLVGYCLARIVSGRAFDGAVALSIADSIRGRARRTVSTIPS
jgi:hypothetical protein